MGWLFYEKPDNVKADLNSKCTFENEKITSKVLDSAIVRVNTYYAAVEQVYKDTGERQVFAVVFMLKFIKGDDPFNFGYKDMDEGMGPYETDCPERILDLLTDPPMNEHAAEWRRNCRETIAKRKARPRLRTGAYLVLDTAAKFGDGRKRQVLKITDARRRRFRTMDGYRCKLKGLGTWLGEYTVVDEAPEGAR